MSDNLRLFNSEYKNVTGFKAATTSGLTQTYLPATDYLTKAAQILTDAEQTQVWENFGIQDLFDHSEPTSTALYAHTVGQTFVFGTQLVKCTLDIAIGGTITMGTNVTEYPINVAINDFLVYNILRKAIDIIPDNADLDDYWQPGVWEISSGSHAETMTNVPTTTSGGKLITIAATAEGMYSSQFYLTTYGEVWRRYKRNTDETPSGWIRVICQNGARTGITKNSSFNASTFMVNVYSYPHFAIIYYNISLPSLTAATTYTMCTIPTSVIKLAGNCNYTVAGQSGNGYLLQVLTNGNFTVYSATARTNSEFIRGTLTVPTTF